MKLVLLAAALGVSSASAQLASQAAKLVGADRVNTHTLETVWNGKRTIFVDFPRVGDEAGDNFLQLHVVQEAEGRLVPIKVAEVSPDGGDPELAALGFANADRDAAKELIVILEWPQSHYDYGGSFLEVRIFDDPKPGQPSLVQLSKLSKHFGLGCECSFRDGRKTERYGFKTIASVKRELRRLGY
jgi:hypothetical protein